MLTGHWQDRNIHSYTRLPKTEIRWAVRSMHLKSPLAAAIKGSGFRLEARSSLRGAEFAAADRRKAPGEMYQIAWI